MFENLNVKLQILQTGMKVSIFYDLFANNP